MWTTRKLLKLNPPSFTVLSVIKKPSNDVFGDAVAHNLDLAFEGKRFESNNSSITLTRREARKTKMLITVAHN